MYKLVIAELYRPRQVLSASKNWCLRQHLCLTPHGSAVAVRVRVETVLNLKKDSSWDKRPAPNPSQPPVAILAALNEAHGQK